MCGRPENVALVMGPEHDSGHPRAFISYAHSDKAFVDDLVGALNNKGVGTWVDTVELVIGDSLVERIGDAIHANDFVIAVVSPASVTSPWCQKELSLAATSGINAKRVKVLPVRLGDAEIPSYLADAVWGDGSTQPVDGLADELVVAMRKHLHFVGVVGQARSALPHETADSHGPEARVGHGDESTSGMPKSPTATEPSAWRVASGPRHVASSGRDAVGFGWQLVKGDTSRAIVVWISRSAMASSSHGLPAEVAHAKQTKGRSLVESLLREDTPPSEVLVSTYGIRWELPG